MKRVCYLEEFLRAEKAEGKAEATLRNHCRALQRFDCWLTSQDGLTEAEVTPLLLSQFIAEKREQYPADHANQYVSALRVYYRWLQEMGILQSNPAAKLRFLNAPAKPVAALTAEQVKQLLRYYRKVERSRFGIYRSAALALFLIETGLRLGEALRLQLKDLDFIQGRILVYASKTGRADFVPMSSFLRRKLRAYLRRRQGQLGEAPDTGFVFCGEHGDWLDRSSAERSMRLAGKRAGLSCRFYPHLLRHTFATLSLMNGAPQAAVMAIGRWRKLETMKRYVCFSEMQLREIQARSSPLANAARMRFVIPDEELKR